jgi:tetratricopeptide (TPR) repeat protein
MAIAAFLACTFYTAAVTGQTEIQLQESKKHFKAGVDLFQKDKYREALDEFLKSYDLRSHWGILYNIGLTYLKLGQKAKALTVLLKFMEKGGEAVEKSTAIEVEDFIQELMGGVGIIRFTGDLSQSSVTVDGEEYPEASGTMYIYVDPGKRYVRVLQNGKVIYEEKITIKKGEEINIDVTTVEPAPTPWTGPKVTPGVTGGGPDVTQPVEEKKKKDGKGLKTAGWAMIGLAAACIVGYGAAGGVALSEKGKMEDVEDEWNKVIGPTLDPENLDDQARRDEYIAKQLDHRDKAETAKLAANVLFAVGAATALAAVGLLVAGSMKSKKESPATQAPPVEVTLGAGGLEVSF